MSGPKWVALSCYSFMNFLIGVNYIIPDAITILSAEFPDQFPPHRPLIEGIYPILYIILSPIAFLCLWRSFYWSIRVSWVLLVSSLWLKSLGDSFPYFFAGDALLMVSSSFILPASASLVTDYFPQDEKLKALTLATLSNPLGIGLGITIRQIIAENDFTAEYVTFAQALSLSLVGMLLCMFPERVDKVQTSPYIGFCRSWKIVMENQETAVMMFSSSLNLAVVYTFLTRIGEAFGNAGYEYLAQHIAVVFTFSAVIGGLVAVRLCRNHDEVPYMLRTFLVLSSISAFWLALCAKAVLVCTVFSLVAGFSLLGSFPMQVLALLEYDPDISQPISANILYFTSGFFISLLRYLYELIEVQTSISGLWLLALLQMIIVSCYLSDYSPSTREIRKKLIDTQ